MSGGYQVDAAALDGLIETLEDAASTVREANAELGGYPPGMSEGMARIAVGDEAGARRVAVLGAASLADAAGEFSDKWRYGLDKLEEAARDVTERLAATRQDYLAMEDSATGLFQGVTDMLSGGSTISDALGGGS